jgi:hypothetical protein
MLVSDFVSYGARRIERFGLNRPAQDFDRPVTNARIESPLTNYRPPWNRRAVCSIS